MTWSGARRPSSPRRPGLTVQLTSSPTPAAGRHSRSRACVTEHTRAAGSDHSPLLGE
ncbi:hypothetical protein [Actinomadura madurae]|uniref:hypothetical protein n=1 Tax=Actinomadura madurae TaxID=1993 RepID=UPI0020D2082A|nr:hypothetical protein [Actinomadura madurae]MCQ0013648.1 hypothetical protein [Actinomadura madurae]